MPLVNHDTRETIIKLVYYGPPGAGKRTSVRCLYSSSLPKETRTREHQISWLRPEHTQFAFFDFPLPESPVTGFNTIFSIYTLSDFKAYPETRQSIFRAVDGIVFVADSNERRRNANLEALAELQQHLSNADLSLNELPHIFQYNKRDLANAMPLQRMESDLNVFAMPSFEAVASQGVGVVATMVAISKLVLHRLLNAFTQKKSVILKELMRRGVTYIDESPPTGKLADLSYSDVDSPHLPCLDSGPLMRYIDEVSARHDRGWLPLKKSSPEYAAHRVSIFNQIDSLPGVTGSIFVGYDGSLVTSSLAHDTSKVIFSLALYISTSNAAKQLGHQHLHQLVFLTNCGFLIVADFRGGILIVVTNSQETECLLAVERTICTNLDAY